MKIDDRIVSYEINKHLPKSTPNEAEKTEEIQLSGEQEVERQDQPEQDAIVNLSRPSKEAQHMNEIISSEPDVKEDKVSVLKERIESGRYKIDHEGVADKLLMPL